MIPNKPILLAVCYFLINSAFASNPNPTVKQFINQKDWNFTENKGQVSSSDIKYYGHQGGVYLYCKPGMLSFVFTKAEKAPEQISEATVAIEDGGGVENPDPLDRKERSSLSAPRSSFSANRADLVLLNSNPNAEIFASEMQEYYENYYTSGNADHGITNVHTFKTITYKSIYPNIDMVLHAKESGMKYEFVVHPGGKVSDIQMQWNGLQNMHMSEDGGIKYAMALGEMNEGKPVSFQGENRIVNSSFIKHYNRVGFKVGTFNKKTDLVIDPYLVWGTYYGDSSFNSINDIKIGPNNDIFLVGTTYSTDMATKGVYQTSLDNAAGDGYPDALVSEFNTSGLPVWTTYYGGSASESGNAICLDGQNNIFIAGYTESDSGIATKGAYLTSAPLNANVFVAKFTNKGQIVWGSYYGGDSSDIGVSISIDSKNNIYVSGSTSSGSGIATKSAYITSYRIKYYSNYYSFFNNDGFLAKFSNNGELIWGTYFGINTPVGALIGIDKQNNIYLAGNTTSDSGMATKGAYQTSYGGDVSGDAYLAKFDSSGQIKWSTYFGGSNADGPSGIAIDISGNIYMTGSTQSISGIATKGAYQTSLSGNKNGIGNWDAFLAKFNTNGDLLWSTYYGDPNPENAGPIAIDSLGRSYISLSRGTYFTSVTTNMDTGYNYQYQTGSILLAEFNKDGYPVWASYYGNELGLPDAVNSMTIDNSGNLIIAGATQTHSYVSTNGAYQTAFKGGQDAFLSKFSFLDIFNDAGITNIQPSGQFCGNEPVNVTLKNFGVIPLKQVTINWINKTDTASYQWTGTLKPDSSILVSLGNLKLSPKTGFFKAWTTDPNNVHDSVATNDTTMIWDTILSFPRVPMFQFTNQCAGNVSFADSASGAYTYSWSLGDGNLSTLKNPAHFYSKFSTYYVNLKAMDTMGCSDSVSAKIILNSCVWPGDANNDKVVDMKDFLAVGIAFGDTGLPRPSASITWTGQPCPDWTDTIAGGINAKYTDCNGDSIVNYADTVAISTNYSLSHTKSSPLDQGSSSDPGFVITPLSDSVSIGKTFQASISIGNQKNPVQNLYGMAFTIAADPSLFEIDKASVKIIPSFFGTDSVDLMGLKINTNAGSSIDLGLTRIDHKNVSGYGNFAILSIPVKATISQKNIKTALSISNNTQISFDGKNIPLYFSSDSVVVTQHTNAINPVSQFLSGINVYPNPFSSSASVQYTLLKPSKITIGLFDMTGKEIGIIHDGNQQIGNYTLDIGAEKYHLTTGVYMLKFITGDGYISRKIVKF